MSFLFRNSRRVAPSSSDILIGQADLLIAYGTSTGAAQEVAQRIGREAYSFATTTRSTRYFKVNVLSLKEMTVDILRKYWTGENKKVIFVISTTGQGEFPNDSNEFWRELCEQTGPQVPIRFAVIGMGDSSYQMYNIPAKKLHARLVQLSGVSPFQPCLCDDQHDLGYVGALNPFLQESWKEWVPSGCISNQSSSPLAQYTLLSCNVEGKDKNKVVANKTCDKLELRKVVRNQRITAADHFQDTRLIAFDTVSSNLTFEPGDVVQVFQENFPDNVNKFFELFPHLTEQPPFYLIGEPDLSCVTIPPEMCKLCGPQPWTWETVVSKMFHLQSIPGMYAFEVLRFFTEDPLIKEKFEEFCGPEGLEELYNYTSRPKRTILEVLMDFPSTAALIPPNYLFEIIPFMRPRSFSIASPPKEAHHIEILVAVVEYMTSLKTKRKGACSYWLAHHCEIGQKVGLRIEKGSFRPPPGHAHVVMIGPGTGIAPFRSLIKQNPDKWDKYLFFGCRNKDKDFYFGDEFTELANQRKLSFHPAFSRDEARSRGKYVQDLIVKEADMFNRMLISQFCIYVYVCGRAGDMPKDVRNAIKEVFGRCGIIDTDAFVQLLIDNGCYQSETY